MRLFLLVAVFLALPVHAENVIGRGHYGIFSTYWSCDATIRAFRDVQTIAVSGLWNTFGRDTKCLERLMGDNRRKIVQIHLINEVCVRNKRCDTNELFHGYTIDELERAVSSREPRLLRRIRSHFRSAARQLLPITSSAELHISPVLESNLSRKAGQILLAEAKRAFPQAALTWNPVGINRHGSGRIRPFHHELHGSTPRLEAPCIANLDGEDIDLRVRDAILPEHISELELGAYFERTKQCALTFLWIAEDNGIEKGGFRLPLLRRNFTTVRTEAYLSRYLKGAPKYEPSTKDRGLCRSFKEPSDGVGGFVFKQSDLSTRGAVYVNKLLRGELHKSVFLHKNGTVIERGRYGGLGNADKDGKRQHWRFLTKAAKLPKRIVLNADGLCFFIVDPKARID